ncbi:putative DDE superfamily endonuclease [Blattamonas nauphoetae]|uniref:DDE superfamily endonuclease n=1 Tax=Blattamonas nauphoetae TaxID=2049346 RepID=A0ABQ9WPH3_9EUKA|nr:putative DDE superfamily endonuclease [Blattamonas nauphoetae]
MPKNKLEKGHVTSKEVFTEHIGPFFDPQLTEILYLEFVQLRGTSDAEKARWFVQRTNLVQPIKQIQGESISRGLGILPSTFSRAKSFQSKKKERGMGNRLLSDKEEEEVVQKAIDAFRTEKPWKLKDLRQTIHTDFGITVSHNFHHRLLSRQEDKLKHERFKPREVYRMRANPADIERHNDEITKVFDETPWSFIFHTDESQYHAWEDCSTQKFLVPVDQQSENHIPVSRSEKAMTLLPCLCLDGSSEIPFFVIGTTIDVLKMAQIGVVHGRDCLVYQSTSQWVDSDLFTQWIERILVPTIYHRRAALKLPDQKAVLITDGLKVHGTDEVRKILESHNIQLYLLPPNSSHLTQPCDLGIFGVWKMRINELRGRECDTTIEELIAIATCAYIQSTCPISVRSAFRSAGLEVSLTDDGLLPTVNHKKLELIAQKLRGENVSISPKKEPTRRKTRPQPFGIILAFSQDPEKKKQSKKCKSKKATPATHT